MQGTDAEAVDALARGDLAGSGLADDERALLEFVRTITLHAYRVTAEDTRRLRELGYSDEQIGEAVYVAALFAFFNRVADGFGLLDPGYRAMSDTGHSPPRPAERHK